MRINPKSVRLTAPVIYLNQVIQNPEAGVPLIAGRPALLRVFVTGDQISFYTPHVRATFHLDGEIVLTELVEPGSDLRDRATGQVRAIRRDWEGGGALPGGDLEIIVSDGLPGGVR